MRIEKCFFSFLCPYNVKIGYKKQSGAEKTITTVIERSQ